MDFFRVDVVFVWIFEILLFIIYFLVWGENFFKSSKLQIAFNSQNKTGIIVAFQA